MTLKPFATIALVLIPSFAFAAGGGGAAYPTWVTAAQAGPTATPAMAIRRRPSERILWNRHYGSARNDGRLKGEEAPGRETAKDSVTNGRLQSAALGYRFR
jgi:hypothetical protein